MKEQIKIYECPYCFNGMNIENIIDENRVIYNKNGKAIVFRCSECFEYSFVYKKNVCIITEKQIKRIIEKFKV